MQTTSRDQLKELGSRFLGNVNWGQLEHDSLQREVVELSPTEFGRRMTAFLKSGCRLEIKRLNSLTVDRTTPFNPTAFIGKGWSIVEEDERALLLTTVDFSEVDFESGLQGDETTLTGDVKLARLKESGKVRLDATFAQALFEEKGQVTLRSLYDTYGLTWMEFAGTVLRSSVGDLYFLYLYRGGGGSWDWRWSWLDYGRVAAYVSPVLASTQVSEL